MRFNGAEEVATAALASCRGVFDPIRPPTSIGSLHTKVLRKKRNKRRRCPQVPLYCSDAAGDWAGYLRTRNRRRARKKTLWELCTMIPIKALR